MSTIKEHIDNILVETGALASDHVHMDKMATCWADKHTAINAVEIAVHDMRKVFESTNGIDKE